MQAEEHSVKNTMNRFRSFRYALILEGIVVGAVSGAVVVLFRYLLSYADELLRSLLAYGKTHTSFIPFWFVFLVVSAIIVARLLTWESFISGSGIPQVEGEMIGALLTLFVLKFCFSLISFGSGAPGGIFQPLHELPLRG